MSRRFYRHFGEVSPTAEETCAQDAECTFCAALRRAREDEPFDLSPEACSPLTPGVQLINLSYSDDRHTLRVELDQHWKRMFEQLPTLGEGLVMTRNEAAILGRCMTFPELAFTTHGIKAASDHGGLWFDFRPLIAARAEHLRRESGHIFGIAFFDARGQEIHRFTATPSTNLDAFCSWVRLHQACATNHHARLVVERDTPSSRKHATKLATGGGTALSILTACRERGLAVRATLLSGAVVQAAHFIPHLLQTSGDWWFACDDAVGLHFCPNQFTHTEIERGPKESDPRLLLYSHQAGEKPALILQSGDETSAPRWSELLQAIV
jgi:Haem utilisation ChuX/HutX